MLLSAIQYFAVASPLHIALKDAHHSLTYADLLLEVEQARQKLVQARPRVMAIVMDNSPAWAVMDIAAASLGICTVPLPWFFSAEQMTHAIQDAGVDLLLCDQPLQLEQLLNQYRLSPEAEVHYMVAGKVLTQFKLATKANLALPNDTSKITYTSGTTGKPKGVCLSNASIQAVAQALLKATHARADDQHLSILPLSTLLENIAGLYVPLLAGATAMLYNAKQVGLSGASGLDVQTMMKILHASQASTLILTPELLNALVSALEAGVACPSSLRFIAVGGATVAPSLLQRAQALNLPVYEGYGLSECASVVALNTEHARRIGSVGKPLPHLTVSFAQDGEILITGALFLGYLGGTQTQLDTAWATGDIGYKDDEGYLHITGRKKNIFITSYGRNVAPEWVERELTLMPAIAQVALFGEAKPFNTAVVVPNAKATPTDIQAAIDSVNTNLPDYAKVSQWLLADAPFTLKNQQLTANYRLRREVIWQYYQAKINDLYNDVNKEPSNAVL